MVECDGAGRTDQVSLVGPYRNPDILIHRFTVGVHCLSICPGHKVSICVVKMYAHRGTILCTRAYRFTDTEFHTEVLSIR